jgi:hypothetical protein
LDLDFSDIAKRTTQPFKLGADGKEYVLQEASADDAIRWRNAMMKAARFGQDGKLLPGEGLADTEALLVQLCLREKTDSGWGPVSLGFVRGLPARALKKLHEKVVEISDMREGENDTKGQALADLLCREDSPVSYEVMRDYIRKVVAGPDGHRFKVLEKTLEDVREVPKS